MTSQQPLRVGLIGAGYIAPWHADAVRATRGVRLAAVVDPVIGAAEALAHANGAQAFESVDAMIAAKAVDAVHILTPPSAHRDLALQCLGAGLHCLVEKPMALSAAAAQSMTDAAAKAGRHLAVSHNFLGLPGYQRLKRLVQTGALGRISSAQINWSFPLAPLRSGPFGLWLLRAPQNLLLELGPHPFSFAVDLFGAPDIQSLTLGQPIDLPGGGTRAQSWRIQGRAGTIDLSINLSLTEVTDDRSVTLRGSSGLARFDYAADVLTISRDNTADLIVNPLLKELSLAGQHLRVGTVNAARQLLSLNQKAPYGLSIRNCVAAFYDGIRSGQPDPRFEGQNGVKVATAIDAALALMLPQPAPPVITGSPKPSILVIGGTGFIGRNLTRTLVDRGHDVRVVSRGSAGPFADIADHVEIAPVDLADPDGLHHAMTGISTVINLARSVDKTWETALANDVATTLRVAEAAQRAGVSRLIYTGTIASYDMSDPQQTITEATGFGDLSQRNVYARSKAECEARLVTFSAESGLSVVIARPGIVLGAGGPLQHWGIGRWHGAGAVRLWGNGRNTLPFVLADDVSDALIRMIDHPAAPGQSFNLTGEPLFTARDYFDAIHQRLNARIRVSSGSLHVLWLGDVAKNALKRHLLRRKGSAAASLADWKSRAHLSPFSNAHTKNLLDWQPEGDRERFLENAIDRANLFGI